MANTTFSNILSALGGTTGTATSTSTYPGTYGGAAGLQNAYGPGSWQQFPNQLQQPLPPFPLPQLEIVNVLECANNDDATEKVGAFRKMIPPEQDLMLFGKWIVVFKATHMYPGMTFQFTVPGAMTNTTP